MKVIFLTVIFIFSANVFSDSSVKNKSPFESLRFSYDGHKISSITNENKSLDLSVSWHEENKLNQRLVKVIVKNISTNVLAEKTFIFDPLKLCKIGGSYEKWSFVIYDNVESILGENASIEGDSAYIMNSSICGQTTLTGYVSVHDSYITSKDSGILDIEGDFGEVGIYNSSVTFSGEISALEEDIYFDHANINSSGSISERVQISYSNLLPGNLTIYGDSEEGILILSNSNISGTTSLTNNIFVSNATITSGTYEGNNRDGYMLTAIRDGTFSGNNFSGYYYAQRSITNTTIEGQSLLLPVGSGYQHMLLDIDVITSTPLPTIDSVTIKGIANIYGKLSSGATIEGYAISRVGGWNNGVGLTPSAEITGPDTLVKGSMFIGVRAKIGEGSSVHGSSQRGDGVLPAIHLDTEITDSTISGGFYIIQSIIHDGSNLSGRPIICASNLDSVSLSCTDQYTCPGSYSGSISCTSSCLITDKKPYTTCGIPDGTKLYSEMTAIDYSIIFANENFTRQRKIYLEITKETASLKTKFSSLKRNSRNK